MTQVFITKRELQHLFETGSNSAAMDLDIYVQPVSHDTNNGNLDLVDSLGEITDMSEELKYMLETGKKISQKQKNAIFSLFDDFSNLYNSIKNSK